MADLSLLSDKETPMLRSRSSLPPKPSVKLFPRLATAKAPTTASRFERPDDSRESELKRLRARLLKMILDNERRRRSNLRPSAS